MRDIASFRLEMQCISVIMYKKTAKMNNILGGFIIDKNRSKKFENIFKKAVYFSFFLCYSNKAVAN